MDNVDKVDEVFTKILIYITIIRQFKEDIAVLHIHNIIPNSFGRSYCNIYIDIKLKDGSGKFLSLYEAIRAKAGYDGKTYFSFYLRKQGYDDDNLKLYNNVEHVHYNYIS